MSPAPYIPKICSSTTTQLFLFLLSASNSSTQTGPRENKWMSHSKYRGLLPKACCQTYKIKQGKIFFPLIAVTWSAQSDSGGQHPLYSSKRPQIDMLWAPERFELHLSSIIKMQEINPRQYAPCKYLNPYSATAGLFIDCLPGRATRANCEPQDSIHSQLSS